MSEIPNASSISLFLIESAAKRRSTSLAGVAWCEGDHSEGGEGWPMGMGEPCWDGDSGLADLFKGENKSSMATDLMLRFS